MTPYYEDGSVTIWHGDCREMDVLGDVLVTDPPYGVNIGGPQVGRNWRRGKGSYGLEKGAYGVYKDTYEEYVAVVAPTIARYVLSCKRAAVFVGPHIWELPKATAIGGVYCPSGAGRHRWGFKTFLPVLLYGTAPSLEIGLGASKSNTIWSSATAEANGHPCPKPLTWMRWLIDLASLADETIVDPFMGSGTTLRAAKDLGRRAVGVEIEECYCEIAATRMGQEVLDFEAVAMTVPHPRPEPPVSSAASVWVCPGCGSHVGDHDCPASSAAPSTDAQVALADLEYVLAWLRQIEAPENIIRLQERGMDLMVGRDV